MDPIFRNFCYSVNDIKRNQTVYHRNLIKLYQLSMSILIFTIILNTYKKLT